VARCSTTTGSSTRQQFASIRQQTKLYPGFNNEVNSICPLAFIPVHLPVGPFKIKQGTH
jgi:hypothetical protein